MDSYPKNAQKIVEKMAETARAAPDQAMAFQGAPGANSHLAALQFAPDCLKIPCTGGWPICIFYCPNRVCISLRNILCRFIIV